MKKTGKKKQMKGSKAISLRVCVSQIELEDYFEDSSGNSLADRGYLMKIIMVMK